jgi:hypothetical protein
VHVPISFLKENKVDYKIQMLLHHGTSVACYIGPFFDGVRAHAQLTEMCCRCARGSAAALPRVVRRAVRVRCQLHVCCYHDARYLLYVAC